MPPTAPSSEIATLRPGDVMACWSPAPIGRLISWATASPFGPRELRLPPSHVAVVIDRGGEPAWVESTTLCRHPCLVAGRPRRGVQVHPPRRRLDDYRRLGGRVVRYAPTPINRLSAAESDLLARIVLRHLAGGADVSRPYDLLGAALSGWAIGRRTQRLLGADLDALFCSELVAALLMRLGRLGRTDPALFSPGRLLRRLVRTGTYCVAAD